MKTIDECYDIITALNEEAHQMAWDSWIRADEEDDESLREDASLEQQEYFIDLFDDLDEETQAAVFHHCRENDAIRSDFECWYGSEGWKL